MPRQRIAGVVLAGGQSRRLGVDKALLTLGTGKPLLTRTCRVLLGLTDELVVVSHHRYPDLVPQATWVNDARPGMGSLGGIYTGLLTAVAEHCLVVAVDMPFLSAPLLRYMVDLPRDYDVFIPRLRGLPEPLHAIYGKGCLGPIERLMDSAGRKILDFFPEVRVQYLGETVIDALNPGRLSFYNINTVAELARAWVLMQQQRGTERQGQRD